MISRIKRVLLVFIMFIITYVVITGVVVAMDYEPTSREQNDNETLAMQYLKQNTKENLEETEQLNKLTEGYEPKVEGTYPGDIWCHIVTADLEDPIIYPTVSEEDFNDWQEWCWPIIQEHLENDQ